jgi:hypothetical protein
MRFSARKLFPHVGRSAGGENRRLPRNLGVCNFLHPAGTTAAHEMAVNDSMPNLAFYQSRKHKTRERLISREFQFSLLT